LDAADEKDNPGLKDRPWAANVVAALAGLVLLALAEVALQVAEWGPENRIFVEEGEAYRLNGRVAERFFPRQYVRVAPGQVHFPRDKAAGTFRIFVLGASTLLGFPNPLGTSFPVFLQVMLEDAYPRRRFEVVNCGITAINSFVLLDFVDEIVAYEPDLVIIYAGHNEFVGPYGVTTPFLRFGNNWRWIRFHMMLQRSKIHYGLKELLHLLGRLAGEPASASAFGLQLVRKEVYLDSEEHRVTEENYRRNLGEILARTQRRGVPVMLATLVSNLRGFYPLRSQEPHPRTEGDATRDSVEEQVRFYESVLRDFPQHAAAHFDAARVFERAGEAARARGAYVRARDLDTIHLRACSPFNRILREAAAGAGALLVDVEQVFAQDSPWGIIGDELVSEYLHPSVYGHFLMARSMVETALRHPEELGLRGGSLERLAAYAEYEERLGYGVRDRIYARNNLILFLRSMPYEERPATLRRRVAELVELQVKDLLKLSYGEIRSFAGRGGLRFLGQVIADMDGEDGKRLHLQLAEVAGPLGLD
jgi:lysophospholipase L1-like esterase